MTFKGYDLLNNGKEFMKRYRLESGKIIKGYIRWFHPINVGDYLFRLHQAHLPEDKEFRDAITWANANGYRYVYSIEYKELPLFSHDLIKVYDFSNERYFIKKDWERNHEI